MAKKEKTATDNQWACPAQHPSKSEAQPHKTAADNEWTSTNKK